jgi:hypothetical protein
MCVSLYRCVLIYIDVFDSDGDQDGDGNGDIRIEKETGMWR